MIELDHVTKRYGAVQALRDVSFRIEKGETVGLLGRNGAGKTTALNLITGYFPPTEGTVTIGDRSILADPRHCRRMIGYLPERPPLYDEMTVESYLRFVCELREVEKKEIPAHISEIISLCGLEEVRRRVLGHLSKGFRQRAGIAQALCGSTEILILDEPTVGLDPRQTVEIRDLIRALSADRTVIFSSHILSEVQQLCSRVIILDEGCMVRDFDRNEPESAEIRFRLKIAGDGESVMKRLQHLDPEIHAEKLPAEEDGVTEARVVLPRGGDGGAAADRLFRTLAAAGLAVRGMREEKETLEEIFISSVRK